MLCWVCGMLGAVCVGCCVFCDLDVVCVGCGVCWVCVSSVLWYIEFCV